MLAEWLHIPNTPDIPGLAFRRLRDEGDYPALVDIINASDAADQVEETTSVENLANEFAHPAGFDPKLDAILAEVHGQPVGYAHLFHRLSTEGERIYWQFGYLLPEWRRKGIGRALLSYTEGRARAHAQANPFAGLNAFQGYVEDTALGKTALYERSGYRPVRYFFFMQRKPLDELPEAPLPPGLEFRPAQPDQRRIYWDAKEEAFRDHWGHTLQGEAEFQRWSNNPQQDIRLWQIVWDTRTNDVVGVSFNRINPGENERYGFRRGWIDTLGVRRPWRGRGVARAILVNSLRTLRERGMTEAVLGVDAENPTGALRLYKSVGFQVLNKDALYRKSIDTA
jgi:GNAT superfamily N-acetyltransferase